MYIYITVLRWNTTALLLILTSLSKFIKNKHFAGWKWLNWPCTVSKHPKHCNSNADIESTGWDLTASWYLYIFLKNHQSVVGVPPPPTSVFECCAHFQKMPIETVQTSLCYFSANLYLVFFILAQRFELVLLTAVEIIKKIQKMNL